MSVIIKNLGSGIKKIIINDLKKRFTVKIDEVEAIKENVVFKIPKKLN